MPDSFVETGKSAYAWHNIDAELAQLTYDSSREPGRGPAVGDRLDPGPHLYLGPPQPGTRGHRGLAARPDHPAAGRDARDTDQGGRDHATPVDEIGCFAIDPIPDGPFRLRCRTADGTDVLTGWITL